MNIVQISNESQMQIKCLIYGDSGIGKTTLVETLDSHNYKVLLLSCDKGTDTLIKYCKDNKKTIDMVPILSWDELQDVYKHIAGEIKQNTFKYDVIFVDGITELNRMVSDKVIAAKPNRQSATPSLQEYGEISAKYASFIKSMTDLNVHIVFTCLSYSEMDESQRIQIEPDLIGKLKGRVPGMLDEVFYMTLKEFQDTDLSKPPRFIRYLITDVTMLPGSGLIKAKDRSKTLAQNEKPSLGYIFNKILGKETEKKSKEIKETKTESIDTKQSKDSKKIINQKIQFKELIYEIKNKCN